MGGESDWVLNGAYIDRAFFRNALCFDSFQAFAPGSIDRYAAESHHCEMTLDGEWVGIYLLSERIKRDPARIDLALDDSGETFIVKLDDEDGVWPNGAGTGTWQMVYPHADRIDASAQSVVRSWLRGWEEAVLGRDPADPDTGIFAYLDLDSAVDLVLLEEFARNTDGYYLSLYLWRGPGQKMRFAPWDMDLTFSQPSYNDNENPQGWIAYRPDMIASMGNVPEFKARLVERWWELRAGVLSQESIDARIDGYVETMGETAYENFEVWPIDEITFGWDGQNYLYSIESYDAELARVRGWIPLRLAWIDANIETW